MAAHWVKRCCTVGTSPIGALAFFVGWSFNYQIFDEQWKFLYGFILLLLVGVLLFGSYQRGSRSWFVLPFFSMQPSEICRVCTLLVAAAFLDRRGRRIRDVSTLFGLGALLAVSYTHLTLPTN